VISRGRKLLAVTGAEPRSGWEQQLFSKYLWRIYRVRLGCNNSDRHLISPVGFFSASKSTTGPNANCGEENPRLVNGDTKRALGFNSQQQVRFGIEEDHEKKKSSCYCLVNLRSLGRITAVLLTSVVPNLWGTPLPRASFAFLGYITRLS
jgi:hypothetical protein